MIEESTKQCTKCNQVKPITDFHKMKSAKDGLNYQCKSCIRAYEKPYMTKYVRTDEYKAKEKLRRQQPDRRAYNNKKKNEFMKTERGRLLRRKNTRIYNEKYPDKVKATQAVSYAVKRGNIQHISNYACRMCGKASNHFHHHLGYSIEHRMDIQPLCGICHTKVHNSYP